MGRRKRSANAAIAGAEAKEGDAIAMRPSRSSKNRGGAAAAATDQEQPSSSKIEAAEREARRRRKRMRGRKVAPVVSNADALATARIIKQVKYFFNSMNMEQSLIDAYAHEGWKGQSREKVRPEKELEKATAKIALWKLKIRQAIRELDMLALQGSIHDSAFDDDGQLDYHKIFCSACHSHEEELDNDIILCDGACNRGFHQKCLDPPLETKDIPPGEEHWICPVCQCKSECLSFLNDHLGTDFDDETPWEKIFPDVVKDNSSVADVNDLPSEDSEDDDYDPERQSKEHEAANGEGEEAKGNEDLDNQDDQDDNDNDDENSNEGDGDSGNSDSDSDGGTTELSSEEPLSGAEEVEQESENKGLEETEVSGKRRRRNVDYRKLHDEMFGVEWEWQEALQSEDEDYGPSKRPKKRDDQTGSSRLNHDIEDGIDDKSKRIPAEAVQRLREEFRKDQLPSRRLKEELSKELGLSYRKVDVWFKNVRTQALKKAKSEEAENHAILTQVGQAQLKVHDLKKTMEELQVLKNSSHSLVREFNSFLDVKRGKRVIYKPVAQVVEKDIGQTTQ